jgi:hypothetical protein
MSTEPNQSASPFQQPVPPAQRKADAATARENAKVNRPATAEPNRPSATWSGTAQERWAEQQARRTAEDPWLDSSKTLTRDKDGNLLIDGKRADASPDTDQQQNQQERQDQQEQPGETVKLGDRTFTAAELQALEERAAAEASRKLTLPQRPEDYRVELPKDFKPPQGVEFVLNPADPLIARAQAWAHRRGLDQDAFSEALSLYAATQTEQLARVNEIAAQERDKIGAAGGQRVDAVAKFLRAAVGNDAAQAFMQTLCTADQLVGWEKIMQRLSSPHGSTFTHAGRDPGEPQRVDPKEYDSWSYSQKKDYAQRFQQRNGRG